MCKRIVAFLLIVACIGIPQTVAAESSPSLSSLSAVLYEPTSGRFLYEKDADTRRSMASTTKLMTALVAAERLPLDRVVTIPSQAVAVEGSSMGLRGGDKITVQDLLTGLLLSSGNDAANALALLTSGSLPSFAEQMNRKAATLGMVHTRFVTPSGLDEGGHGSTARDMALLGAAVLKNERLAAICKQKTAVIQLGDPMHEATVSNHNRLLRLYPYAIGLKTGYTVKSGKCLVSAAEKDGVTLVAVTLNGGDYWNDHIALYEYGFQKTAAVTLPLPELSAVSVAGGVSQTVAVTAKTPASVVLLKEEQEQVECRVQLPAFIWAPVAVGDPIGRVTYTVGDRVVAETTLTAARSVDACVPWTFWQRWQRALYRLVAEWMR